MLISMDIFFSFKCLSIYTTCNSYKKEVPVEKVPCSAGAVCIGSNLSLPFNGMSEPYLKPSPDSPAGIFPFTNHWVLL